MHASSRGVYVWENTSNKSCRLGCADLRSGADVGPVHVHALEQLVRRQHRLLTPALRLMYVHVPRTVLVADQKNLRLHLHKRR